MEFRAAAEIDKSSGAAFWGLARAQENLGKFSETAVNLRKAVELDKQNLDAKAKLGNYFLAFLPARRFRYGKTSRRNFRPRFKLY